jgi:hypothetical protein
MRSSRGFLADRLRFGQLHDGEPGSSQQHLFDDGRQRFPQGLAFEREIVAHHRRHRHDLPYGGTGTPQGQLDLRQLRKLQLEERGDGGQHGRLDLQHGKPRGGMHRRHEAEKRRRENNGSKHGFASHSLGIRRLEAGDLEEESFGDDCGRLLERRLRGDLLASPWMSTAAAVAMPQATVAISSHAVFIRACSSFPRRSRRVLKPTGNLAVRVIVPPRAAAVVVCLGSSSVLTRSS